MTHLAISSRKLVSGLFIFAAAAQLAACATPHPTRLSPAAKPSASGAYKVGKPYQVGGIWYVPREDPNYDQRGIASWYGPQFHMKATANGELFDMNALTAAHTTLPLPSIVEVTNLENGRRIEVRVNDRGPFVGNRIIDVSQEAARQLGFDRQGLAKVRVRYVRPAPLEPQDGSRRYARAPQPAPVRAGPTQSAPQVRTYAAAAPAPFVAQPPATPEYLPEPRRPSSTITQAALDPVEPARSGWTAEAGLAAQAEPAPAIGSTSLTPGASGNYRIQAGAFGNPANAERAVQILASSGKEAVIEPVERNGATLYRVLVEAASDEGEAYALRDLVAGYGFADARVIIPF